MTMAENNALGRLMTIQYTYTLTSEQLGGGEAIMLQMAYRTLSRVCTH